MLKRRMKLRKALNFQSGRNTIYDTTPTEVFSVPGLRIERANTEETKVIWVLGNSSAGVGNQINERAAGDFIVNSKERRSVALRKIVVNGVDIEFHNDLNIIAVMLNKA